MKFSIFTHVNHTKKQAEYFGYPPYVREMNIWLKYVDEVEIVAPCFSPSMGVPITGEFYEHPNLIFSSIPAINFLGFITGLRSLFKLPLIIYRIFKAMRRSDHIHLRCPGNTGLIACFTQIFFPGKPKTVKYAGNWDPDAKQPWSYKLQKWLLSNTFLTRNMTVLVYGNWANQSKSILSFFTASFSEKEKAIINKEITAPYKFLFVGNLVPGKQPSFALQIVDDLNKRNIPAELHLYGDGELMGPLQDQAKNKSYIHLYGNQPLNVLKQAYKDFHFLILASKSEGWPKAVAEAMFFGCIPIATAVSCVPWMLGYGSRGILISDGNAGDETLVDSGKRTVESPDVLKKGDSGHPPASGVWAGWSLPEPQKSGLPEPGGAGERSKNVLNETVDRIIELLENPEEMGRMSIEAQEWSQEYTLERFEEEIKKLLVPKRR